MMTFGNYSLIILHLAFFSFSPIEKAPVRSMVERNRRLVAKYI